MSAPDNRVTACCYYGGATDPWDGGSLESYWNGPLMQGLRRLQFNPDPPKGHGCETCHLFTNRPGGTDDVYDLTTMPEGLSRRQEANWRLASEEYRAGAQVLKSRPARVYGNFGFACNISCTMCHQVPRRLDNRSTISADHLLSWADDLEAAQEVHVIGGEPFVLPEAIRFIRGFTAQDRFESVRLVLASNGTVLHKHWATLHRKMKLSVTISLDGMGEPFEGVRIGAKWGDVERNILRLIEAQATGRPEWRLKTASLIQKSTIANLPDFARWHAKHGLATQFSDFISAPGVEDTFHRENFLHNPQLLAEVPGWREYFDEAVSIFAKAGMTTEVRDLSYFKDRVEKSLLASLTRVEDGRRMRMRNDWTRVDVEALVPSSEFLGERQGMQAFLRTRLGDYAATPYVGAQGGSFRVRLHWPRFDEKASEVTRRAHASVQDQYGVEIKTFREILDFGVGTDHILTGEIPPGTEALRVVVTPVGEEVTLIPKIVELDLDPGTVRTEWPPKPRERTRIEKLKAMVGLS